MSNNIKENFSWNSFKPNILFRGYSIEGFGGDDCPKIGAERWRSEYKGGYYYWTLEICTGTGWHGTNIVVKSYFEPLVWVGAFCRTKKTCNYAPKQDGIVVSENLKMIECKSYAQGYFDSVSIQSLSV